MANNKESPPPKSKIIQAIKSGNAKMRPRSYFIFQAILMGVAVIFVLFLVLLAVSFIIFALQENGGLAATGFGLIGWARFFHAIPWSVILLSLALVLILMILLRRYPFIYNKPSLYLLLMLTMIIALGSLLLASSNLHQRIESDDIPVIQNFYQYEAAPHYYMYRGTIVQTIPGGFVLENTIGQTSTVLIVPSGTLDAAMFPTGTFVLIFGAPDPFSSTTVDMFAIEKSHPIVK